MYVFKPCIYMYIYMLALVNLCVGHTYARAHLWDIRPPIQCYVSLLHSTRQAISR